MKWIVNNKIWYSGDVIEKIASNLEQVVHEMHCENCDGCGYFNGCADKGCGTYQAIKCLELLDKEEG